MTPMRRTAAILAVLGLAPLLMGGGGLEPGPPPEGLRPAGSPILGRLALDPHDPAHEHCVFGEPSPCAEQVPAVTTKAHHAVLVLQSGPRVAAAAFTVLGDGKYTCGCDLKLTNKRFLDKDLSGLVPADSFQVLLEGLGLWPLPGGGVLQITAIISDICMVDQDNPANTPASDGQVVLIATEPPQHKCLVPAPDATYPGQDPIAGMFAMDFVATLFVPR